MESQAPDLTVEFLQKVYSENVLHVRHDVWDVHPALIAGGSLQSRRTCIRRISFQIWIWHCHFILGSVSEFPATTARNSPTCRWNLLLKPTAIFRKPQMRLPKPVKSQTTS